MVRSKNIDCYHDDDDDVDDESGERGTIFVSHLHHQVTGRQYDRNHVYCCCETPRSNVSTAYRSRFKSTTDRSVLDISRPRRCYC